MLVRRYTSTDWKPGKVKTTKPRNTLILFATFTAVFLVACNLYNQVQIANGPLLGAQIDAIIPMAILSFLVASYTALSVAFFILETPLSVSLVRGTILSYILALCFVLFGKSIGISGINLNPFQPDLISASSFLNVLVFVPAGFLLQSVLKKPQRTALVGLCGIILIEFAQFALSLGIADIIDIIANEIGVLAGISISIALEHHTQIGRTLDGKAYLMQKKAPATASNEAIHATNPDHSKKTTANAINSSGLPRKQTLAILFRRRDR